MPGWKSDVSQIKSLDDLPEQALQYIDRVSQLVDRPVEVVSIGPDRDQTIFANTQENVHERSSG